MNKFELISYAMDFNSFLLRSDIADKIDKILLFGSIVRGDFDKESDIDIFVDTKYDIEDKVKRIFRSFDISDTNEKWRLKGVKNILSVKTGELNKWKIRRSVISDGIILYGKYKDVPEDVKYYLLLKLNFRALSRNKKISVWRKLYGYKQKIGSEIYSSKGLLSEVEGRKIDKGVILIPIEKKQKVMKFLKENKIKFSVNEIWSDNL